MSAADPLENFRASSVLQHLHGFQRDAAEYAFDRLFLAADSTHRFLVADEVGLGKTLIAKGILAKTLEHLKDKVQRIDIVYICSNLAIAAQNITRLNPVPGLEFSDAERITLLPIHLNRLNERRVNFIAFTPGTSLELGGSLGSARERMLLYALLQRHWSLKGSAALNVLQGWVRDWQSFRERVDYFVEKETISEELSAAFFAALDAQPELRKQFDDVCLRFPRPRDTIPDEDRSARNDIVGKLRNALAKTCINALQPDLVILDEFQRFKSLLSADSEEGQLARHLFEWTNNEEAARVLLLSATPYKSYTLQHELAEENHYDDFLRTVAFLDRAVGATAKLKALLERYRQELYRLREGDSTELIQCKTDIEHHLTRVMSRTERLSAGEAANGMLRSVIGSDLPVEAKDLKSYVAIRRLADELEVGDVIEYWKSSPYPMNFMEGYQLKRVLDERLKDDLDPALTRLISDCRGVGLPTEQISRYADLGTPPNAKLRELTKRLVAEGAFDVLWLPPSLPYYQLAGSFSAAAGLTKRLVFSAWHLVPRSLAVLLSYESERRAIKRDDPEAINSSEARKARSGLLRFAMAEERRTGMPSFTMLYPCEALAKACDPRLFLAGRSSQLPSSEEVVLWAMDRVRMLLPSDVSVAEPGQAGDEQWYWAAPILIDAKAGDGSRAWWSRPELASRWFSEDHEDADESIDKAWSNHVDAAKTMGLTGNWPTGRAPEDLVRVLALMGLAGPATCALRALLRLYPEPAIDEVRDAAARIGWGFRTLYNRPESMALVRSRRRDPYWMTCLEYGLQGGLSAVLDEYLHVLRDSRGHTTSDAARACPDLASAAVDALQVRTASLDVDDVEADIASNSVKVNKVSMRSLFAMRFGSEKTEDEKQVQRDSAVGAAFNSPFWPFVLATTSVGQEGLDFHWYCHAVVHWNLPSNPVDLEQREGRIHRFKGHAVRKNVAKVHAAEAIAHGSSDIWAELFRIAARSITNTGGGLVPYWMYPVEDGAWIERHVPLYPLSRDQVRFDALQRSLGAYRMVFGQPRQDELLAYLVNHVEHGKLAELSHLLRINLAPPMGVT